LRADHVGVYGSGFGLTPNLDRLARKAIIFENAVAASSWTRASIGALFTGRYPTSTGVRGRDDGIGAGELTIAEVLSRNGFQTFAVSTNGNAGRDFGFDSGFDRFVVPALRESYPDDFPIHVAEGVTREGLGLVDERDPSRPFFLFLHYVDPHDPYLPRPLDDRAAEPAGRFDGSRRRLEELDRLAPAEVTQGDRERIRRLYRGEVRYCDQWIGKLLRGFEERGLRDAALWIVTADHGEGLWDHGHRSHGRDLFEEQIHVPLIVDLPDSARAVRRLRIPDPVSLVDVAPTALSLLGVSIPGEFEGRDLRPLAEGARHRARPVFADLRLDGRALEAVRIGRLKLVRDRNAGEVVLYDLARDASERVDLAQRRPRDRQRLESVLNRHLDRAAARRPRARSAVAEGEVSDETMASLRALGYLDGARQPSPATPPGNREGLASMLDFARGEYSSRQLLHGFYEIERKRRWMAPSATVALSRGVEHRRWRLSGWIDLDLHGRDRLVVTSRVDGGPPTVHTIASSGPVELGGELSPSAASTTVLELECEGGFRPAARGAVDVRELCLVVWSVGLEE
jgi:arylsulfatase A-like enzyme